MKVSAVARQYPRSQTKAPTKAQDLVWQEAGELLEQNGIPGPDHSLMQENIATYLAHRDDGDLSPRWQAKLHRELAAPYTDGEVHARIEDLENSLQACLRELPAIPSAVYISGSFVKGRLGANSDLNGFALVGPEHMTAGYDSYENPSFPTRVQNGILALGGALSTTPLIGPVVNKVADFFVSQDHQDLTK